MNLSMFETALKVQSEITDRTSKFATDCYKLLFEAARYAAEHRTEPHSMPCIVDNGTGTGKTTFCLAMIANLYQAIPGYSAAFCVATIDAAQAVYDTLAELLPMGVAIYSSAHQENDTSKVENENIRLHIETHGSSSIANLLRSPIVVCTHELWVREGISNQDLGVRKHSGSFRTHVFLDEFPDTITTQEVAPSDFDELADELDRLSEYQSASDIARTAENKLRERCGVTCSPETSAL